MGLQNMEQSLFLTAMSLINQLKLLVFMIVVDKEFSPLKILLRSHQTPFDIVAAAID